MDWMRHVDAVVPKDWDHYAIHVIEPLLNLVGAQGGVRHAKASGNSVRMLKVEIFEGEEAMKLIRSYGYLEEAASHLGLL